MNTTMSPPPSPGARPLGRVFGPWLGLLLLLVTLMPSLGWAGEVLVSNRTVLPLRIVDAAGVDHGVVGAGLSMVVVMPAGTHTLNASRLDGGPYASRALTVPEQGGPTWQILPVEGILQVINQSSKAVEIRVDGQTLVELAPSGTARLDGIRAGQRALEAWSGDLLVASKLAEIGENSVFVWRLEQTAATGSGVTLLRVANFAGQPVDLYLQGDRRARVFPGDSVAMVGIPTGKVKLEARTTSGQPLAETQFETRGGEALKWTVTGPDGGRAVLEVVNETSNDLRVCVDGAWCLRVNAGKSVQYDAVRPGLHSLQAYGFKDGRLIEGADLELGVGIPYRWIIEDSP